MKLYKISQEENNNYDTYDSAIVAAESEEEARIINPGGFHEWSEIENSWEFIFTSGEREVIDDSSWTSIKKVKVEYIGEAESSIESGVILASFNAG